MTLVLEMNYTEATEAAAAERAEQKKQTVLVSHKEEIYWIWIFATFFRLTFSTRERKTQIDDEIKINHSRSTWNNRK